VSRFARTAVPASRSSAALLQVRRRIVIGLLLASSVLGLFSGVTSLTRKPVVPVVNVPNVASPETALAEQVVRDLFAGRTTSVPVASKVPADFGANAKPARMNLADLSLVGVDQRRFGATNVQSVTLVRFYARVTGSGCGAGTTTDPITGQPVRSSCLYQVGVPMLTCQNGCTTSADRVSPPVLAALPTLTPLVSDNTGRTGLDYSNYGNGQYVTLDKLGSEVTKHVTDAIYQWAADYVGGDSAQLMRDAGSDKVTRSYQALKGWKLAGTPSSSVSIAGGVPAPKNTPEGWTDQSNSTVYGGYVFRVTLAMTPPGTNGQISSDYDVWVDTTKGTPLPVLAWGTSGTAQTLTPHVNGRVAP